MLSASVADWFNARWASDMGAVDGADLAFIAALIREERPKTFVEIGCASGLSTSVIAMLLNQIGPAQLHSFDLGQRFYADPSKPVGYLLEEAGDHGQVDVEVHTECTSLDVGTHVQGQIDMCFIDAAHKHPWPLIDTLALLDAMKPGGIMVHHDLQMFRGDGHFALGPKVLFDQLGETERLRIADVVSSAEIKGLKTRKIADNIFALRVPQDKAAFATRIAEGFFVGWDREVGKRVPEPFAESFSARMRETFGAQVQQAFDIGFDRYNPRATPRVSTPPASLPRRLARRLKRLAGSQ